MVTWRKREYTFNRHKFFQVTESGYVVRVSGGERITSRPSVNSDGRHKLSLSHRELYLSHSLRCGAFLSAGILDLYPFAWHDYVWKFTYWLKEVKRNGIGGDVIVSALWLSSGLGDGNKLWREMVVEDDEASWGFVSFAMLWKSPKLGVTQQQQHSTGV